jgi:hypothetical protein
MVFWIRTSNFVLFVVNELIKGEIEKPSGQYLGLICDESLTCHGLNSNPGHFSGSTTISLFHVENHTLLVVWPENYWDGLSVIWPQNHWDGLLVVWPQNH